MSENNDFDSDNKSYSEGNPDSDSDFDDDDDDEIVSPDPTIRILPHSYSPEKTVQQDIHFNPQPDDRGFGVMAAGLGQSTASMTGVTHSIREMTDEDNSSSDNVDSTESEYSTDSMEESDTEIGRPTDPPRFRVSSGFSGVDQSKASTIDSIDNDGTFLTTPLQSQIPQQSRAGQSSTQANDEAFVVAAPQQDSDNESTSSGSYETASEDCISDSDSDSEDMEMRSDYERGAFPELHWPSSAPLSRSHEPDSSIDFSKSVSDDTLSTSLASQSYTQIVASSAISANAADLRSLPRPSQNQNPSLRSGWNHLLLKVRRMVQGRSLLSQLWV